MPFYPPQILHTQSWNWTCLHRLQPATDHLNYGTAELLYIRLTYVIAESPVDWKTSRSFNTETRFQMNSFMHQILCLVLNTINSAFQHWYNANGNTICRKPHVCLYNSPHQTFPFHILYQILHTQSKYLIFSYLTLAL